MSDPAGTLTTVHKPPSTTLDDERIIPGRTDPATYQSHLARYHFAVRWIHPSDDVLETACGSGYGTALLAGRAHTVLAADYSPLAIAYARTHFPAPNLSFVVMDCQQMALRGASFDVIVSFEVFEHLENAAGYLAACRRILRPGGRLLLSTPNRVTHDLHLRSIGVENDFHINLMDYRRFLNFIRGYFPDSQVYGQRRRGNWLYGALRAADVFNLRLRLLSARRREQMQQSFGIAPASESAQSQPPAGQWVFSRSQLRQANNFVAVCRKET